MALVAGLKFNKKKSVINVKLKRPNYRIPF